MRRFSRGRAAPDESTPPATGTSEAAGDAATDAPQTGAVPVPADGSPEGPTAETRVGTARPVGAPAADATLAGPTTADATRDADATAAEAAPGRDLPAGIDPDELAAAPGESARRGRVRRRLHYLRHVRELLLRDLGGFYAEAHRSERGPEAHRRLLDVKARRLATLDAEVRELEARLSEPHAETVLREPGIGGTCPECGELHGSDARFCSRCGGPLRGRAARERAGTTNTGAGTVTGSSVSDEGDRMTTASLWGRRRTTPAEAPSEATRAGGLTQPARRDEAAAGEEAAERPAGGDAAGTAAGEPDVAHHEADATAAEAAPDADSATTAGAPRTADPTTASTREERT